MRRAMTCVDVEVVAAEGRLERRSPMEHAGSKPRRCNRKPLKLVWPDLLLVSESRVMAPALRKQGRKSDLT